MKIIAFIISFCFIGVPLIAQETEHINNTDSLIYQKRKKQFLIGTASVYTLSSVGLYFAWYKNHDQQGFHFFNDWNEWNNIDKLGHMYASYIQSDLLYQLGRWSGFDEQKSLNIACLTALGFQTSFEIMDGFSSRWGFSVPDFTFNILGIGGYYVQQKFWKEQRLRLKFSYWPESYSDQIQYSESGLFSYTLADRADAIYGKNFLERIIRDYNGQTIWISANLKSFWKESQLPDWLNIAFGVSAENLYGGFENRWEVNDENVIVPEDKYPRVHQYVLSPDIDFSRIKTESPFVRTLLDVLNIIKLPAPAVMINSNGELGFSVIYTN